MTDTPQIRAPELAATGVEGLDEVLEGGLPAHRLYVLEGGHGSGKTTLALQFCREGARRGERVLYVSTTETEDEIRAIADSHGWSLDGIELRCLDPRDFVSERLEQSVFHAPELELPRAMAELTGLIERFGPQRFVLDSITELRLLAGDPRWFRQQLLALREVLATRACTSLFCDDQPELDQPGLSIVHGVLRLEHLAPDYGPERRRLRIPKLRGHRYSTGYHDLRIEAGGLIVFPRLGVFRNHRPRREGRVSSGLPVLDRMVGGGVDRGSMTLLLGPAGAGKSSLAMQYAMAAAARGERAMLLLFDEREPTVRRRAAGLGMDLDSAVERDRVEIRKIEPAELTPGELSHALREAVDGRDVSVVVVDSLAGYAHAMPDQRALLLHLHELLSFLAERQVATIGVLTSHPSGDYATTAFDLGYIADTTLRLHRFEADGDVRRAVSVDKRRGGVHESGLRSLSMGPEGIAIGEVLHRDGMLLGPEAAGPPERDDGGN